MKVALVVILSLSCFLKGYAQKVIPLYSDGLIPNSIPYNMKEITLNRNGKFAGYKSISKPTLEMYLPAKANSKSAAVIICPGGGYGMESYELEGRNIAKTFIKQGVVALILKYRLPSDSIMKDKSIGPLQDAQQAIKLVRLQAAEWNIDINKIGIMGFSAGGHLASSAGVHFDTSFIPNKENISLRPDFSILVYPVISMADKLAHLGSRTNLLGPDPTPEKIKFFSNDLHITEKTPPTWITHAGDDKVVDVDNSIAFYEALRHSNVPVEMHLYPKGDHGFVLKLPAEEWMYPLFGWMKANNWIQQ
ncbi:alpha/beta hydrolase [Daejeonella sp.]|uniref:alpha/beta hydrolase n=1 Tax=Daejeonella sp. TaxID=2805397 RepID=UPI0039836988